MTQATTTGASALPDAMMFRLDRTGTAQELDAAAPVPANGGPDGTGMIWQHLRRDAEDTPRLLRAAGLDEFVIDALMAEETRPRCTVHENGVVLILRGVNLHPDAEPEDMVSVRLWLSAAGVIGVSVRPLNAIGDLVDACRRGAGPTSPGDFAAKLALRLADRAEPAVAALNEEIDAIEETALEPGAVIPRGPLSRSRRAAILLRRHLVPQRDALTTLEIEDVDWLADRDRSRLREAADRVTRLGEELDAIRDRAQLLHDQVMDQRAERLNQRMLILAIVSAIFLPLGLVTGLLGINVGGMPGASSPWGFWVVCALLLIVGVALFWWFRRIGMFR
jgi:zinc transporter